MTSSDILAQLRLLDRSAAIQVANKMNFLNLCVDADFVVVTMSGRIIEYEIKVSRGDFLRDKLKLRHKIYSLERPGELPNKFYYATAPGIVTIEDIPQWAGWFEMDNGILVCRKPAPTMTQTKHSMTVVLRLARAMMRRQ